LGGEIWFLNPLKWKKINHKMIQNQHTNILVKEIINWLIHCICKFLLKCQKTTKIVLKNTSMSPLPFTKMLLGHS